MSAPTPRPIATGSPPAIFTPSSASSKLTALISAPAPKQAPARLPCEAMDAPARSAPRARATRRPANPSRSPRPRVSPDGRDAPDADPDQGHVGERAPKVAERARELRLLSTAPRAVGARAKRNASPAAPARSGSSAGPVLRAIKAHLGSRQVSRVIYGAIIGLALIVALEEHPPSSGVVVATLLGTALAVGLAEFYSDIIGTETRLRRHVRRAELPEMMYDVAAVAYGIAFPAVFFVLAAADAIEEDTAFTIAKWSGVGLIAVYGYIAAHLAGDSVSASTLRALAAGLIGALLIVLKSLVH